MVLTYKKRFNKKYKQTLNKSNSIKEISILTKIPVKILKKIQNRGLAAYYTNYKSVREKGTFKKGTNVKPSKKLSPAQWSVSRIYSFIIKPKSKLNHDRDLIAFK